MMSIIDRNIGATGLMATNLHLNFDFKQGWW